MDASDFIRELRNLTANEIRRRLDELAAEEKALRLLLRAALRAESKQQPGKSIGTA